MKSRTTSNSKVQARSVSTSGKCGGSGLLFLAMILILAQSAVAGNTWYANGVKGSDNNDCTTPQTACKTIGHAISLASPDDSVILAAATYTENLNIGFSLNIVGAVTGITAKSASIIDGGGAYTVVTISSANADVTLSNLTIRNGVVWYHGFCGGIKNGGTLTINSSTISGNFAHDTGYAGGIYNPPGATLTINNSTISGNGSGCGESTGCSTRGGGVYNSGTMTINNSTISGNSNSTGSLGAFAAGGGVNNYSGILAINNSTISGNSVVSTWGGASGGGIWNDDNSTLAISNSTISGNSAEGDYAGTGGILSYGAASLQNSIVAINTGGNCSGGVTSNGYNLSSDETCNFNNTGDLINTHPRLLPLQNNGGPTQTMKLGHGSPAVDAGNPNGCTDDKGNLLKTDQRGALRPGKWDTGGCDMGAFELQID